MTLVPMTRLEYLLRSGEIVVYLILNTDQLSSVTVNDLSVIEYTVVEPKMKNRR